MTTTSAPFERTTATIAWSTVAATRARVPLSHNRRRRLAPAVKRVNQSPSGGRCLSTRRRPSAMTTRSKRAPDRASAAPGSWVRSTILHCSGIGGNVPMHACSTDGVAVWLKRFWTPRTTRARPCGLGLLSFAATRGPARCQRSAPAAAGPHPVRAMQPRAARPRLRSCSPPCRAG